MSEKADAATVRSALSAAIAPWTAYDFDDQPKGEDAPAMYVLMQLSRTVNGGTRMCGGRASREWRLSTVEVGSTVDEVRWLRHKLSAALDDKPIDALETTRLRLETDAGIRPDDGLYSGSTDRTYHAPVLED